MQSSFKILSLSLALLFCLYIFLVSNKANAENGALNNNMHLQSVEPKGIPENPDVEILNFEYKTDAEAYRKAAARGVDISSGVSVGNTLYVKWRIKSTGKEYEDTVAMDERLPANMMDKRLGILIEDSKLFVYLVTFYKNEETGDCPLLMYKNSKCARIYP